MIKINVLRSLEDQRVFDEIQAAVAQYEEGRKVKSFADRHPELGKMINCQVCGLRHRTARVCVPTYATSIGGTNGAVVQCPERVLPGVTAKQVYGASQFRGRIRKHRNKNGLQALERAAKIFNEDLPFFPSAQVDGEERDKLGKTSLSRAVNELRGERAERRRTLRLIQKRSRRINRG